MNPLQLRKIELEKEKGKMRDNLGYGEDFLEIDRWNKDSTQECAKYWEIQAELKGINLGLKVLEDYSQQNEKANDNVALLSTAPKGDVAKPESSRAINGDGSSADTQYQKGYQDAIKEVLDKINTNLILLKEKITWGKNHGNGDNNLTSAVLNHLDNFEKELKQQLTTKEEGKE